MYKSAPFLREFWERASRAAANITTEYEIIFVNDGSLDESLATSLELFKADEHVLVVDLSRNFGHHKAMMTGLAHASGERILLMDCDLEEDPAWLATFWAEMDKSGADVVYGVQDKRKGRMFERMTGALYYRLFNAMSPVTVPTDIVTARLMTQRYVASLLTYQDREVFLLGLWVITGYEQVPMVVHKTKRPGTSYSLRHRVAAAVNGVTSFTTAPLVIVFYLGFLIAALALLVAASLVIYRLFIGAFAAGWPSVFVSVWLIGGLTILCLGIIGMYVAKVFSETKRRPYTTVRAVHSHKPPLPERAAAASVDVPKA
jgi:putative glycosyltransferase